MLKYAISTMGEMFGEFHENTVLLKFQLAGLQRKLVKKTLIEIYRGLEQEDDVNRVSNYVV